MFLHPLTTPAPISSISEIELGVRWTKNPRTLLDLRKAGKLPPHFKIGKTVRYLLVDVEEFERSLKSKQ